jgi:D-serine deaminase-like pyridoxal phosphate-dependent protein
MDFEKFSITLQKSCSDLPLPLMLVDLDAWDENLDRLLGFLDPGPGQGLGQDPKQVSLRSKTLRLATKSLRVPALVERALSRGGPALRGLMCFSAREARSWLDRGVSDLLLAYPVSTRSDFESLAGTQIKVVVDSVEGVRLWQSHLSEAARRRQSSGDRAPTSVPFVVDCDASLRLLGGRLHLGVRRSPVRSAQDLSRVLQQISTSPHTRAVGLMSYEAQVAGLPDQSPWGGWTSRLLHPVLRWIRSRSIQELCATRQSLRAEFEKSIVTLELFNGGGSGSFNWAVNDPNLTEVTAGSALFGSHLFDHYSNIRFKPSLAFACPVVRKSDHGYVTVLGGGYVSSGPPGWDKVPVPVWPKGLSLLPTEACGEVQTPLRGPSGSLKVGDWVWFRPAKAGEIAERFDEAFLISLKKGQVERVPTYRGLKWGSL